MREPMWIVRDPLSGDTEILNTPPRGELAAQIKAGRYECRAGYVNGGDTAPWQPDPVAVVTWTPEAVAALAYILDESGGEDGQWDGGDVCDWIATIVEQNGGWAHCPDHDCYSAALPSCPFDHSEDT